MLYDKKYAQVLHAETKEIRGLIGALFNRTVLNFGTVFILLASINLAFYYAYFTSDVKSAMFQILDAVYYIVLTFSMLSFVYFEIRLLKTISFLLEKWKIVKYALSENFVYSIYDGLMNEVNGVVNSEISRETVKEVFIRKINDQIFDTKEAYKKGVYKNLLGNFEDELREKAFEFMMKNLQFRGILVPAKSEYDEPNFRIVYKGKDGSYGESDYKPHLSHEKGKFENRFSAVAV